MDDVALDVRSFTVNVSHKVLFTEVSDVGGRFPEHRIYNDACDVGMAIRNPKTGGITVWWRGADEVNPEEDSGEFIARYFPTVETLRKYPHLKDWKVEILND